MTSLDFLTDADTPPLPIVVPRRLGTVYPISQTRAAAHWFFADGAQLPTEASEWLLPNATTTRSGTTSDDDLIIIDAQVRGVVVGTNSPAARCASTPNDLPPQGPLLLDETLLMAAQVVDDLEVIRIANENRLRTMTRSVKDSDGLLRGLGLDESNPDVARLAGITEAIAHLEYQAVLGLQRSMRAHPLGPWVKSQRGVGDKQAARLLATIGDPYWNTLHNRPRTVSELWAYGGLHVLTDGQGTYETLHVTTAVGDPFRSGPGQAVADAQQNVAGVAAKHRKGHKSNWNNDIKTRTWLVIASCIKSVDTNCKNRDYDHDNCACSPYRVVYDLRKRHTAVTRPEWTPGHRHQDAMRIASKELLKDLWRAARDYYHTEGLTND